MKDIGVDMRRDLKLVPAKVIVVEHATHAYDCPNNECLNENGNGVVVKADAPAPLLSGSLASASGFLAFPSRWLRTSRFRNI